MHVAHVPITLIFCREDLMVLEDGFTPKIFTKKRWLTFLMAFILREAGERFILK